MDINAVHAALDAAITDSMPADLKAAGWVYRDMPRGVRLDDERWAEFLSAMGEGNYRMLASSTVRTSAGVSLHRAQFFISPAGLANLKAYRGDAGKAYASSQN